jgi:hypothetical protein
MACRHNTLCGLVPCTNHVHMLLLDMQTMTIAVPSLFILLSLLSEWHWHTRLDDLFPRSMFPAVFLSHGWVLCVSCLMSCTRLEVQPHGVVCVVVMK